MTELLPLLTRTHCRCGVNSALSGSCQSLLHHAGQAVELVLLIDLKQAILGRKVNIRTFPNMLKYSLTDRESDALSQQAAFCVFLSVAPVA